MSEATRYTIFFVLSFVTFTAWGFRQVKKISEEKAQPLGFFRFGPMMICLIVRYLVWLLHHK